MKIDKINILKISYYLLFTAYIFDYFLITYPTGIIKQVIVFIVFITLLFYSKNRLPVSIEKPGKFIFLLIFNALGLVTASISKEPVPSLMTLAGLNIYFIIFYLQSCQFGRSSKKLFILNSIVIKVSLIMCLIALLSNIALTISQFHILFYGRTRIFGVFQQPNLLAAVCFVSLVASFINFRLSSARKSKIKYLFSMTFFFILLILSNSRGALASFIIFIAVYVFLKIIDKFNIYGKIMTSLIFISGALLSLPKLINHINDQFNSQFDNINELSSGRFQNWEIIMNGIKEHPLNYYFGAGLSSGDEGALFNLGMTSDNGYLIWIFQAGIISLYLILILLVNILIVNIKNKTLRYITVPLFFSFIFYAFFENFLMSLGHIVPFYCLSILFIAFNARGDYLKNKKINKVTMSAPIPIHPLHL